MYFAVFRRDALCIYRGSRGTAGAFGHQFGGPPQHSGLKKYERQPPVHQLFLLDCTDKRLAIGLRKARWLPLLCAIRYGACDLAYRVLSDSELEIITQKEVKAWKGFPTTKYPDALAEEPIDFHEESYSADNPSDVCANAGVFGYDKLTAAQLEGVVEFLQEEGLLGSDPDEWDSIEEGLEQECQWPFVQGPPNNVCPSRVARCTRRTSQ